MKAGALGHSTFPWILPLALIAFCACRDGASKASVTSPADRVVNPLQGQAATNQSLLVERIRHLPKAAPWERRKHVSSGTSASIAYLLLKPAPFEPGTNYPLVLSLHGGAPRRDLDHLLEPYLPGLAYGLGRFISPETQGKYPSFVVAPWSGGRNWDDENLRLVIEMLDALQREFRIDTNRIYVTGQSMGGWGTWSVITQYPARFAGAIPICGGGNPAEAPRAKAVPVWAFHGTADTVVPVHWTRNMVTALRQAGGTPRYWEYYNATHAETAERAYGEPELIDWLFAQSRRYPR